MGAMTIRKRALFIEDAPFTLCEAIFFLHEGRPVIESLTISHEVLR
jgi:hypothetical protein